MVIEESPPPGIDPTKPSVARVYDYMLGGKNNFAIDRQVGELSLRLTPDGPAAAKANRGFLRRMVRFVADQGITQFLDLGSGLPTQGNVHEIAHERDPRARVVYVDSDPMVLAHGRALLADSDTTTIIQADAREPETVLNHPTVATLLDLSQPVALLMLGILHHFRDDEDPDGIAARFREPLVPGSYLAISHFHNPGSEMPEIAASALAVEKVFNENLGTGRWRTREEILGYFGDFTLVEPGLVPLAAWRPEPGDEKLYQPHTFHTFVGGLAVKE